MTSKNLFNSTIKTKLKTLLLGLLCLLCACTIPPEKRVATPEVVEEVENRKILRLSDAQIVSGAQRWGSLLANQLNTLDSLPLGLLSVAQTWPDSISEMIQNVYIHSDTTQARFPKEAVVLKAYFSAPDSVPLEDNIQKINDQDALLYTRPYYRQDTLYRVASLLLSRAGVIQAVGAEERKARKKRFSGK
ncbi:MAG: hypothetical protein ACFCUI_00595 [Bernardetiaceae bacterium]